MPLCKSQPGRWITQYSVPNGLPYKVWKKPVPRVHDTFSDCVVNIYNSLADAKAGERQGGTGFLVVIPLSKNTDWQELYVITNRHVVNQARTPVVRINRKDGTVEYVSTTMGQWFFHPDECDVAAFPLNTEHTDQLKIVTVTMSDFLTDRTLQKQDVGIGDDVFMIGRFINHEGRQQNTPAVRFGNIAMMPLEKITGEDGLSQESFLIEVRSLPGYSGSPVFVFSTNPISDFSERHLEEEVEALRKKARQDQGLGPDEDLGLDFSHTIAHLSAKGPYLLGIDWCHLHTTEMVRGKGGQPIQEEWVVRSNSGMAGVIPAWKIQELLEGVELSSLRKTEDEKVTELKRNSPAEFD